MGNGAKAQQKRERNSTKGAAQKEGGKSQSKANQRAMNVVCSVCRQSFLLTTRLPALEEHAQNKHNKTAAECFPQHAAT